MSRSQNSLNSSENPTPGQQVMRQEIVQDPAPVQEIVRSGARGRLSSGSGMRLAQDLGISGGLQKQYMPERGGPNSKKSAPQRHKVCAL